MHLDGQEGLPSARYVPAGKPPPEGVAETLSSLNLITQGREGGRVRHEGSKMVTKPSPAWILGSTTFNSLPQMSASNSRRLLQINPEQEIVVVLHTVN